MVVYTHLNWLYFSRNAKHYLCTVMKISYANIRCLRLQLALYLEPIRFYISATSPKRLMNFTSLLNILIIESIKLFFALFVRSKKHTCKKRSSRSDSVFLELRYGNENKKEVNLAKILFTI